MIDIIIGQVHEGGFFAKGLGEGAQFFEAGVDAAREKLAVVKNMFGVCPMFFDQVGVKLCVA